MPLVLPRQTLEEFSKLRTPGEFRELVMNRVDVSQIEVTLNRVLTAVFVQPERTAGGIIKPPSAMEEDVLQGKLCLILKVGPAAFKDDSTTSFYGLGSKAKPGVWCSFRLGNASLIEINKIPCRVVPDDKIEMLFTDALAVTS